MLSDSQIRAFEQVFYARMQAVTNKYLAIIGEHIRDIGTLKPSDVQRIVQMRRFDVNVQTIRRAIQTACNLSAADVERVFLEVAEAEETFMTAMYGSPMGVPLRKNPAIRIVATAIALESIAELTACINEFPWIDTEVMCMQVAHDKKAGPYHLMAGQNPIYIFTMQAGGSK